MHFMPFNAHITLGSQIVFCPYLQFGPFAFLTIFSNSLCLAKTALNSAKINILAFCKKKMKGYIPLLHSEYDYTIFRIVYPPKMTNKSQNLQNFCDLPHLPGISSR